MGWSTKSQAPPSASELSSTIKPPAGLTMPRSDKSLVFSSLSDGSVCGLQNTWCECDATTFQLRSGPDYNRNKFKIPSLTALYEVVAVDFVKSDSKVENFGSRVEIPESWTSIDTHHPDVPPLIIVNAQLPSDFSSTFFYDVTDGDGWSLVTYFRVTEETANALADLDTAPPAVKLLANYCKYAAPPLENNETSAYASSESTCNDGNSIPTNWAGRFKVTIRCENMDNFGLPSFIASYNAKPILIRNTGTLYRGNEGKYVEMDINIHKFGTVPKKALDFLFNRFDQMVISMGFCIESRMDEEMPETLFGCVTLNRPMYSMAFSWTELTNPEGKLKRTEI